MNKSIYFFALFLRRFKNEKIFRLLSEIFVSDSVETKISKNKFLIKKFYFLFNCILIKFSLSNTLKILFAILHVGVVTKYFSDVIVAGFTTGAAYHIVVSQINVLIGVKIEDDSLPFKLIEVKLR